ncbi:hypothetical protein QBC34DRAFT_418562, partial [Podospora aff. communis PSN243]
MKPISLASTLAALFLPVPILAAGAAAAGAGRLIARYPGGRCSGKYDDGRCICLDRQECFGTYGGSVVQGSPGAYPCPNDPDNVWGCYVYRCPTMHMATDCRWKEACVGGRPITNPVCPGGNDYICCQY